MPCSRKIGPYDCCSVVQGDCFELMKYIPDGMLNAVVTSPPYNQLGSRIPAKTTGLWGPSGTSMQWINDLHENGYADDMEESEYQEWQNKIFSALSLKCSASGSLFYNHQIRWRDKVPLHPVKWFNPGGWNLRQEIIWERGGGLMLNARMWCRFDERILWFVRECWKWNQSSVGEGTVWHIPRLEHKDHPVAYPEEIPARCIAATTDEWDLILDPFCGSGSTLVAAKKLRRHFVGFEISPKYCEIAQYRIATAEAMPTLFEDNSEQLCF